MANKYGRFTADGDWSNTNNWSSTRTGATGAGAPSSNDDVYLLDPIQFPITTGLSQAAVDLNSMTIGPDFNGSIGSAGSPLIIAVSGTSGATLRVSGSGSVYITAGTNNIDRAVIACRGAGRFWATGGTYTILENRSGNNEVTSGCTATTVYNYSGVPLNLLAGSTVTTVYNFDGASLLCSTNLTTLTNDGTARCTNSVTITTLHNYNAYTHQSTGTITTANCYPGSTADALAPFTVTTLNHHLGAKAFENQTVSVTKSTTNTLGW